MVTRLGHNFIAISHFYDENFVIEGFNNNKNSKSRLKMKAIKVRYYLQVNITDLIV
jgi:hypothetical protein